MRTFHDAKLMAKALRESLSAKAVELSHSESLEIVAKQFGTQNWNVLAARLDSKSPHFECEIPILRIFSMEKATEFYCDFLGFTIDWTHDELGPLYVQLS